MYGPTIRLWCTHSKLYTQCHIFTVTLSPQHPSSSPTFISWFHILIFWSWPLNVRQFLCKTIRQTFPLTKRSPTSVFYTVKNAIRIPGFTWNLSFLILQNTHLLIAENFAHSPSWILSFSSSKKCSATCRGTKFRAHEWNPPSPERISRNILEILAENSPMLVL